MLGLQRLSSEPHDTIIPFWQRGILRIQVSLYDL
jgi:hypothetical protein